MGFQFYNRNSSGTHPGFSFHPLYDRPVYNLYIHALDTNLNLTKLLASRSSENAKRPV